MARKYVVRFDPVSLTAAGNLCVLWNSAAAGNIMARITRFVIKINHSALPTAQQLQFVGSVLKTVTAIVGGSGMTVETIEQGQPAAKTTSTLAPSSLTGSTSGSEPYSDACYAYTGIDTPAPGDGITLLGNQVFRLDLIQAPAGAGVLNFSGYVEFQEEG